MNTCQEDFATPLHLASIGGNIEIVQLLVDKGANVEATNLYAETPLHKASKNHRVKGGSNKKPRRKQKITKIILMILIISTRQ